MTNKLLLSNSGVVVKCDRNDTATLEALQEFYPVHSNRKGTEHCLSIRNVPELLEKLRGVTMDNIAAAPLAVQSYYNGELNARAKIHALLAHGHQESPVVNEHLTLMDHQQLGREIAKVRDRFCFFFDVRLGKTPLSLSIIYDDLQKHTEHKWLIVAPLILIENAWMEDATKFVPGVRVVNCHAATKAKRLKALQEDAQIYITNTESFAAYKEHFDKINFIGCFVDESSSMKSNSSKQTKALVEFAHTVKRFYLLSGRPAPNGQYELYPQLKAIDYYCVPSSYAKFKERFFVNISYNPQFEKLEMRADRKEEFTALVAKYAIYVDQSDALVTAGRTFHTIELTMPEELKKHYNKLKRDLYLETEGKQITTAGAGAAYNKLRQVSSGFIIDSRTVKENKFYDEDNKELYVLSNYRFDALRKLLNTIGNEQCIIWASYRHEFHCIKDMLGDSCAVINGEVSNASKSKAISDFKRGIVQYLVAHPGSAKFGLTLTNAHIAIYFSMSFSYEDWYQSVARIYGRIESQPKHCEYYTLITRGCIDADIYKSVSEGKQLSNMDLLMHLKGL